MISNGMGLIEKIGASSPSHSPPQKQQQQQQQQSLSSSSLDLDAGKFVKPNFSSMLLSSSFMSGDSNALLNPMRNNQTATAVSNVDASLGSEYELQQEKWRNYFQLLFQQQQINFNCKFLF
jgi:hypothetical protein